MTATAVDRKMITRAYLTGWQRTWHETREPLARWHLARLEHYRDPTTYRPRDHHSVNASVLLGRKR